MSANHGLEKLLDALEGAKSTGQGKWQACCPAHDDSTASLSITREGEKTLVFCHAGCPTADVLAAVGMKMADLGTRGTSGAKPHVDKIYDYRNADGSVEFQVVRMLPKDFRQRRNADNWSVKGCRQIPYRLPQLQADPSAPVFVVEGEKDVDALAKLGVIATCNAGGAGKWRKSHAEYLRGRRVVILPDNDDPGRKHAEQVAATLAGIAQSVKAIALPGLPAKGDASDWLAAGGTAEQLLTMASAAPECDPSEASTSDVKPSKLGPVAAYAARICAENHFARDIAGKLYRFHDGAFRTKGEAFVEREVKRLANALDETKRWSTRFASEIVAYILVDAPELWDGPPGDVLNVENGLLDLRTGELKPHSELHLSSIQLPVKFDPAATCPAIDQFVGDVFPEDAVALAWEIPALMMSPDPAVQKAVLLLGAGGNGKSTWLTMVTAFLGKMNIASVSLHRLESDRFAAARLLGKLANICADLPSEHLSGTSTFKALTGGDSIEAEHKFCDSFSFTPFARLVFSANSPPRSSDGSDGFFDRWVVVPFDASFRGTEREISRQELDARLSASTELSGLLNKSLAAWQEIQRRGGKLSESASVKAAWEEFHKMTDPLSVWLDGFTIDDPEAMVSRDAFRTAYGKVCEEAGRVGLSPTAFGLAMKRARPDVKVAKRTLNGRVQWSYVGIGLRDSGFYPGQASQGSQGSSTCYHAGKDEFQKGQEIEDKLVTSRETLTTLTSLTEDDPSQTAHPANGERVRITL